ncbi:MAG: hypothetical protein ACLTH3_09475 [Lachnospira sp.]
MPMDRKTLDQLETNPRRRWSRKAYDIVLNGDGNRWRKSSRIHQADVQAQRCLRHWSMSDEVANEKFAASS